MNGDLGQNWMPSGEKLFDSKYGERIGIEYENEKCKKILVKSEKHNEIGR